MERYPCSLTEWFNIVKTAILPKLIYRFNVIPIKITAGSFTDWNWWNYPKIYMEKQRIQEKNNNNNLEKKKTEGLTLPNFKT